MDFGGNTVTRAVRQQTLGVIQETSTTSCYQPHPISFQQMRGHREGVLLSDSIHDLQIETEATPTPPLFSGVPSFHDFDDIKDVLSINFRKIVGDHSSWVELDQIMPLVEIIDASLLTNFLLVDLREPLVDLNN